MNSAYRMKDVCNPLIKLVRNEELVLRKFRDPVVRPRVVRLRVGEDCVVSEDEVPRIVLLDVREEVFDVLRTGENLSPSEACDRDRVGWNTPDVDGLGGVVTRVVFVRRTVGLLVTFADVVTASEEVGGSVTD